MIKPPLFSTSKLCTINPKQYHLPTDYPQGGFLSGGYLQTSEPTSDGLDYVLCHYFAEFTPDSSPVTTDLPDYLVPFSQDEQRYFVFDFRQGIKSPSVRYIDLQVDQWLDLAPDFTSFLNQLKPLSTVAVPDCAKLTPIALMHYLLVSDAQLDPLLQQCISFLPPKRLLQWLDYLLNRENTVGQLNAIFNCFLVLTQYFKPALKQHPHLTQDIYQALTTSPQLFNRRLELMAFES